MRHVDDPALAADLGDRLLQRHPARDLLVDEEADDLALVGGHDLLADDHLHAVLRRPCRRRRSAPEISLWSVTAIAPRPTSRAVASSTSTGVAQSLEWSVCMCRSTSMQLVALDPRADLGLRVRVVPERGEALVDLLDLVGHARPRQLLTRLAAGRGQLRAQLVVASSRARAGPRARRRRRPGSAGRGRPRAAPPRRPARAPRAARRPRRAPSPARRAPSPGRGTPRRRCPRPRTPRPRRTRRSRGGAGSSAASAARPSCSRRPPPTAGPPAGAAARAGTAAAPRAPRGR